MTVEADSNNRLHKVYIGVGSNLGDRARHCEEAIDAVGALEGCLLDGKSPFYETEPVGFEDQGWFVNAVVRIRTGLDPEVLQKGLESIERAVGRTPGGPRFGPRVLDLDILFFDDLVLKTGGLEIPHPRLHERRFVLRPLCDLAPELVHPVLGETMASLLSRLKDGGKEVRLYS